jgi:5-formyltetrahydrofolate cyclo-ligase
VRHNPPTGSDHSATESDSSGIAATKDNLRNSIRTQRRLRPVKQMATVADALGHTWPTLRSMAGNPGLVLGYQPTRFEPDPRSLLVDVMSDGLQVLLPRPVGSERLEWITAGPEHLESRLDTMPSPSGPTLGVGAEPLAGKSSVVLVPALAADPSTGLRLGQGGGYYDRLIESLRKSDCRILLVAIVHDNELLSVPAMPHDQAVDVILTESGVRPIKNH